nr:hypothetical protein [Sphingomonas melonis]
MSASAQPSPAAARTAELSAAMPVALRSGSKAATRVAARTEWSRTTRHRAARAKAAGSMAIVSLA